MDISPSFTYRDLKAAIEWLERAFGFERGMVVEDGDRIVHAELWHGDACVMLGGEREDGMGQPPGSGWTYVVVEDADTHHARRRTPGPRSSPSCSTPTTAHATTRPAIPRATSGTSGPTGRYVPNQ